MRKSILLFTLLAFFSKNIHAQSGSGSTVIYVSEASTTGVNDGTNWTNAYRHLQTALDNAEYGQQIWVAAGTYLPDSLNDRSKSFVLPAGVKVYGGFAGTEASLADRRLEMNPTILSGNIGAPGDSTDNSYHVVYLSNPDSNTLIDGLTIMSGFALGHPDGTDADVGGGIRIEVTEGGLSGWPTIANCRFQNNTARRGGAVSARSAGTLSNGLIIDSCLFETNTATSFGGAVYVKTEQEEGTITSRMENCRFMSNSSGHMGGALYFSDISGKMSLKDNVFFQNFAPTMGGAIGIVQEDHNGNYSVENADFSDNISLGEGGAINFICEKPLDSQLEIIGADFSQNRSLNASGGAVNIVNFGGHINLKVDRSAFIENETSQDGAAISFYDELFGTSDIRVTNSRIEKNRISAFSGSAYFYNQEFVRRGSGNQTVFYNTLFAYNEGAYSYLGSSSGENDTYIYNCTFYDNGNQPVVNWLRVETNTLINVLHIGVKNSIIWEPGKTKLEDILLSVASGEGAILYDYQMDHNLFSARNCEASMDIYDCGGNNLFSQDPQLRDPIRGDFRPKPCSPAINAGVRDELLDEFNEGFDLNANARILEDIPDIGAYETASFDLAVTAAQLPDCPGGQDGSIQLNTPLNIAFNIRWETGVSATGQLEGLAAGDYNFTLTTNDGCTYTLPYTLAGPDTMRVTYTITPASGPDSRDGGISLGTIRGGTGPHRVQLFQGDRAVNLGGLAPGAYELRVTDRNGCVVSEEIVISFLSDVVNLEKGGQLKAFPNPVRRGREVRLEWEGVEGTISEIRFLDVMGRTLMVESIPALHNNYLTIKTQQLEAGWYLLQLIGQDSGMNTLRLLVK
jgi:predicted outer membrane repeat protein